MGNASTSGGACLIWSFVLDLLWRLRSGFSRLATFSWFAVAVVGMMIRGDRLGVTSLVRAHGLPGWAYDRLLDCFHSRAWCVDKVARLWAATVMGRFPLVKINGRPVLAADGIKRPKSGRKMPAVKRLHQSSGTNTKPKFINGHSLQSIGVLVQGPGRVACVPLHVELVEGLVFSNRDHRTVLGKLAALCRRLLLGGAYLVADAYYNAENLREELGELDIDLVSRAKSNAVAYRQPEPVQERKRGRPALYGDKVEIKSLARDWTGSMPSPFEGDSGTQLLFRCEDLLVKPSARPLRFVAVSHPTRGTITLTCTDLGLAPEDIIRMYALRFKIEVAFKAAVHVIGAYDYHFWMRDMNPLPRKPKTQYLHMEDGKYRDAVRRKVEAFHRFMQAGTIAHGIMIGLGAIHPAEVWRNFGSWMRTMYPARMPSEFVVAQALRSTKEDFLRAMAVQPTMGKFIRRFCAQNDDDGQNEAESATATEKSATG